jgi:hypothetical protein
MGTDPFFSRSDVAEGKLDRLAKPALPQES